MQKLLGVAIGAVLGTVILLGIGWLESSGRLPAIFPAAPWLQVGAVALAALAGGVAAVRISDWAPSGWIIALLGAAAAGAFLLATPLPAGIAAAALAAPLLAGVVVSGVARPA